MQQQFYEIYILWDLALFEVPPDRWLYHFVQIFTDILKFNNLLHPVYVTAELIRNAQLLKCYSNLATDNIDDV